MLTHLLLQLLCFPLSCLQLRFVLLPLRLGLQVRGAWVRHSVTATAGSTITNRSANLKPWRQQRCHAGPSSSSSSSKTCSFAKPPRQQVHTMAPAGHLLRSITQHICNASTPCR